MTSTSARPTGSSNTNPVHRAQAGTGHFMLTLCRLAAPVSIRPPQSPRLKRFTFFMSRAPKPDGGEQFSLHMGYFATLADAERWVEAIRGPYPNAFATIAPAAFLRPPNSEAPSLPPVAFQPVVPQSSDPTLLKDDSLTDTQVLEILEARHVYAVQLDVDARNRDQIALLRPDDTSTLGTLLEGGCRRWAHRFPCRAAPLVSAAVRPEPRAIARYIQGIYAIRDRKPPGGAFPLFSSAGVLRRSNLCEASRRASALSLRLRSCSPCCRAGGHARTRSRYGHFNPVSRGATS